MRRILALAVFFLAVHAVAKADTGNSAGDDVCSAISRFVDAGGPQREEPAIASHPDCALPAEIQKLDFVIVTAPNPLETHLGLWLDRQLESIQLAATDSGLQFKAAKIPWDIDLLRDESDPKIREDFKVQREKAAKELGVLLFRDTSLIDDLAVLLVPETPTGGIEVDAFCEAVEIASRAKPATIQVLGPSFSVSLGSLESIVNTCQRFTTAEFAFTSGSTVGRTVPGHTVPGHISISFQTTQRNISHLWDALNAALTVQDLWQNKPHSAVKIAVLSESETRYSLAQNGDVMTTMPDHGPDGEPVLRMTYPREISRLRNAFSDQELKAAAGAQPESSFRNLLTFRIAETGPSVDTTPVFAPNQTPLSQNAVLESISRTLRDEQVNLAAVLSTDPFDSLFIARYLRDASPDVRVLILDSDLLWVRAAEDFPFTGILSVTPYPLIARTQQWREQEQTEEQKEERAPARRKLFPSRAAQGIYNAMIGILDCLGHPSPGMVDYFSRFPNHDSPGGPPIWVSVVSRGEYWPLALIDNHELKPVNNEPTNPAIDVSLPLLWRFIFVGLTVGAGFHFVMVWAAIFSTRHEFMAYGIWWREEHWFARWCYLLVSSTSLLALYGVFIAPVISLYRTYPGQSLWGWHGSAALFFWLFAASTLIPAVWDMAKLFCPPEWEGDDWHFGILVLMVAYLAFLSYAVKALFFAGSGFNHEQFFFAYRSLHFSSSVAPIAPILFILAGFFWWGRVHLTRLVILHDRLPWFPLIHMSDEGVDGCVGLKSLQKRLNGLVQDPLPLNLRTLGAFGLLIAIYFFLASSLGSLEYYPYDLLILISLGVLFALLFLTWYRSLLIWSELHLLLQYLERHPIRFAFSALPRQQSWSAIFRTAPTKRSYWPEILTRDALRVLFKDVPEPHASAAYNQQLEAVLGSVVRGQRVPYKEHQLLLDSLKVLHAALLPALTANWNSGKFAVERNLIDTNAEGEPIKQPPPADPAAEAHRNAESIIAVQFVSYIRNVLLQIRNLTYFVLGGFVLSIIALNCYPFQSPTTITAFISVMFVMFAGGIVVVMAQAERNSILSRITNTEAGALSGSFYGRLVGYLGLPALTVLGAQFPAWGRFLFSWVQPMLEALK